MKRVLLLVAATLCFIHPASWGCDTPSVHSTVIHSVADNGTTPMAYGKTLIVTMSGAPGGTAMFDVGSHYACSMTEMTPGSGNYLGAFPMPLGEVDHNARVTVHLWMPDGRSEEKKVAGIFIVNGAP